MLSRLHRNNCVTILGLYPCRHTELIGEVWTLNDWYMRYPWLEPDRLFNLHLDFDKDERKGRFPGDWKKEYRESGAKKIYTLNELPGVDSEIVDTELMLKVYPEGSLTCSTCIMMAVAGLESFTEVRIEGTRLLGGEYIYQIPGILKMIDFLRKNGLHVFSRYEDEWLRDYKKIDWKNVKNSVVPYWVKDRFVPLQKIKMPIPENIKHDERLPKDCRQAH